jgi:hypothetical protein
VREGVIGRTADPPAFSYPLAEEEPVRTHRILISAAALLVAGCGLLPQTRPPSECGLEGREIAWAGNASLAAVGLQSETGFPEDERGKIYVTEGDINRLDAYCIVLSWGTNESATHSGAVPDDWEPPEAP